jgi:hypothetical protein
VTAILPQGKTIHAYCFLLFIEDMSIEELIFPDTILLNEKKTIHQPFLIFWLRLKTESIEELIFPSTVLLNEKKTLHQPFVW